MHKILIFNSSSQLYGSERGLLNIVEALVNNYDITVVLPQNGPLVKFLRQYDTKVKIFPLSILMFSFSPFYYLKFSVVSLINFFYFLIYTSVNKIDILYTNNSLIIFPSLIAFFSGKKHIWHIREFFHQPLINKLISFLAKKFSSGIICQSQNIKNTLFPVEKNNISIIYEGINLQNINIVSQNKPIVNIPSGAVVLSIISRIHPFKGQYEFIKSIRTMFESLKKDTVLFIVGDISPFNLRNYIYKKKIEIFIKKNRLSDRIFLLGFQEEIKNILSFTDICILPFLRNEPFGLSLLEALVLSKQVFVNFNPGFREIDYFFKGKCRELSLTSLKEAIEEGKSEKIKEPDIPEVFSFDTYKKNIYSTVKKIIST